MGRASRATPQVPALLLEPPYRHKVLGEWVVLRERRPKCPPFFWNRLTGTKSWENGSCFASDAPSARPSFGTALPAQSLGRMGRASRATPQVPALLLEPP